MRRTQTTLLTFGRVLAGVAPPFKIVFAMSRNTSGLRKGGPGRPKGVPNKATLEGKEFARLFISDAAYLTNLRDRIVAGKANHLEELLWHYAYGKPRLREPPQPPARGLQIIFTHRPEGYDPMAPENGLAQDRVPERERAGGAALPAGRGDTKPRLLMTDDGLDEMEIL